MKIGLVQMDVSTGDKEKNIEHAFSLLEQTASDSNVLILPELWTIGYDFRKIFTERFQMPPVRPKIFFSFRIISQKTSVSGIGRLFLSSFAVP